MKLRNSLKERLRQWLFPELDDVTLFMQEIREIAKDNLEGIEQVEADNVIIIGAVCTSTIVVQGDFTVTGGVLLSNYMKKVGASERPGE